MSGPNQNTKAIVIGAGIGGLAVATRLAAKGYMVSVFDANSGPGGKAYEFLENGYRFDAGPSLFTMPQWLDEVFEAAGKNPRDYYQYQRLSETCRYFYPDGTRFTAPAEPLKLAETLANIGVDKQEVILKYLNHSKWLFETTKGIFLQRSLHKLKSFLNVDVLKGILRLPRIGALSNMNQSHLAYFKDPRWVQLFNRYATYNGSNPYKAPATLSVIPHLEYGIGAFYPKGGIHSIPKALHQLGRDMGVNFHFNMPVDKIVVESSRVKGIQAGGNFIPADIVVSNSDVYSTYHKLIEDNKRSEKVLNQERSSSALIFYWGIKREFPNLGLHNIFFSGDYYKEFKCIAEGNEIYDDPTIYINITSKMEGTDAPAGCENWFTMINAPYASGQDWDTFVNKTRENILRKLNKELGQDVSKLIAFEEVLTPPLIQQQTSSYAGSLYGTSSNSPLAAFFRHPNFSRKYKGLYFVGGSVHPGGGIPLVLSSARIVADIL